MVFIVGCCVAGLTVGQAGVSEFRVPVVGVVTIGALTWEMTTRRRVTGLAVGQATMVKIGIPIVGIMAVRALAWEVAARRRMASLAIGEATVIKCRVTPIIGVVAG